MTICVQKRKGGKTSVGQYSGCLAFGFDLREITTLTVFCLDRSYSRSPILSISIISDIP